ncbi:GNAT family N-acetyltransferase [Martelella alba]|uniref:GNAT family N-acetyltransferase n=2 Tax=Martelella alba TaxID=2590451 RepID=A0ABY2SM06_9HYPH|nr:GNAT family N-acetyltransferase [Martelella alba]
MRRAGIRRPLVFSGDPDWSAAQADGLKALLPGDWVHMADDGVAGHIPPSAARTLLGREFHHGVFDARRGLAADGLAALAGTLKPGSWLVILAPDWESWPWQTDRDSLRWSGQPTPIATPNFARHFRQSLQDDPEAVVINPFSVPSLPAQAARPDWRAPGGEPTAGQRAVLTHLLTAGPGVFALTAPRGRGKSAVAGMLAAHAKGPCRVVAPAKSVADVFERFAAGRATFFSPDAMLDYCRHQPVDGWLLVDEAAAIPMPLLREMISYFPRVLLTTTVQGYEGTGRGFLLKFCAGLPHWHDLRLSAPLRWAETDPLERWLDRALLLEPAQMTGVLADEAPYPVAPGLASRGGNDNCRTVAAAKAAPALVAAVLDRDSWRACSSALAEFYFLLCSAHYRTSPLDLRRLLDAPGQHFMAVRVAETLIGALWTVDEGGLPAPLAHDVWAGRRRPPGSLAAQSLAAHGGLWSAPRLLSRRVSRIAVAAEWRRGGVGCRLLRQAERQAAADGRDYLSVSFGLTDDLLQFWRATGFTLVHIGSHLEASSGCYSAMALLPLTGAGRELVRHAAACFGRDAAWRGGARDQTLNKDDWRTLAGFAFAHRPPEACRTALERLTRWSDAALPVLRYWQANKNDMAGTAARFGMSGRKTLIRRLRDETAGALAALDSHAARIWRDGCGPLDEKAIGPAEFPGYPPGEAAGNNG